LSKSFVLPVDALRWRVDERTLDFESTSEIDPAEGIIGQPVAMEALRFGVESNAPGQNIYVRGTSGTGRTSLVRSLLAELDPQARRRLDRCYVHNFLQPDQPRLITLPAGQGPLLRRRVKELADFIENHLLESLDSDPLKASRDAIAKSTQDAIESVTKPLEKELKTNGLALVRLQTGQLTRTAMFPVVDDQPVPPEELAQLLKAGKVTENDLEVFNEKIQQFTPRLQEVSREANKTWQQGLKNIQEFFEHEARAILHNQTSELLTEMPQAEVKEFIKEVIDDVIENRITPQTLQGQPPPQMVYGVNVICSYDTDSSPVVTENTPTVPNLLGSVEPEFIGNGQMVTNYRGIRAGALVHADGGYLILDAYDVLSEPGSWRLLMRALRTGSVEIVPADLDWPLANQSLKPQAIDISVRIILIGSSRLFYQLDQVDQDFANLFKVLADFNSEIERTELGINQYASVVARICRDEDLVHFGASGVAALAEHGARIASRKGKITARFGRIADIVREASFLTTKAGVALLVGNTWKKPSFAINTEPACLRHGFRSSSMTVPSWSRPEAASSAKSMHWR